MKRNLLPLMLAGAACLCYAPSICADETTSGSSGKNDIVYKVLDVPSAGQLQSLLGDDAADLDSIVVKGNINAEDFKALRKLTLEGKLCGITLSDAIIENKTIPAHAFQETHLRYIDLPDNLEKINDWAFAFSTLKKVNLPASLNYIGLSAFRSCKHLTGTLVIPEKVSEIQVATFLGAVGIEEIKLPAGLKKIGEYAFDDNYLKKMTLPEGLEEIGEAAFARSSLLKEIILPESVKTIGKDCFNQSPLLEKVVLSPAMQQIPEGTFNYCINLSSVDIPSSIEKIGKEAFAFTECLAEIEFKEGLRTIDEGAFEAAGLKTITFPASIAILEEKSFASLDVLQQIVCKATTVPVAINSSLNGAGPTRAFGDHYAFCGTTPRSIPVYVPAESVEGYKTGLGWDWFTNILPMSAMSGVDEIVGINKSAIAIKSQGNRIMVESADTLPFQVNVFNPAGMNVISATAHETFISEELPSGIYIVRTANCTRKLIIK